MPEMSLYWPRDLDGYRTEPGAKGKTIAGSSGTRIVRNGGKLDCSSDRMKCAGLYRALAATPPTPEGALSFVCRYGFLQGQDSEDVEHICNEIAVANYLLDHAEDRELLARWLEENARAMRLTATITKDGLFFRPVSLQSAIYLQFFEDLENGAQLRLCKRPGCETWFKYGPGTGKRNTAQYCSTKCEKAHNYERSKEKAK